MRRARNVWLDLTADGDVFVPDRRFGRLRRLIDGSLLLSHTLHPIELAPSLSRPLFSPSLVSSPLAPSRRVPCRSHSRFTLLASCFSLPASRSSSPAYSLALSISTSIIFVISLFLRLILQSLSVEVQRRHFAVPRHRSCFCRAAYK